MKHTKCWIWAVDPFEKSPDAIRSAAWTLKALTKSGPAEIYPTYLRGSSSPELIPEPEQWNFQGIRNFAEGRLQSEIRRVKLPGIRPIEIPREAAMGIRHGVRQLLDFARKRKADLIVVSTHAKSGLKRWALGSFTETLALHSDIPLLTVHPNWRRTPEFKSVLFPTDFSDASRNAYERVLEFAETFNSRIFLLHKVHLPELPGFEFAFAAQAAYAGAFDAEARAKSTAAESWAKLGRARGLKVDVIIDRSRSTGVTESVLKRARRLNSVVALASQSGPVAASLLGSTARQILRKCEQPVWIIHPAHSTPRLKATSKQRRTPDRAERAVAVTRGNVVI